MTIIDIFAYLKENPEAIARGEIPLAVIIDKIRIKTSAMDIPYGDIPHLQMHRFNAYHLPSNELLNLAEKELRIKAIRIPITDTTKHYIEKNFVSMNRYDEVSEDYIYLAYEEQVGYLYSNSSKLFLEAALARGVSKEDIEGGTEAYTCYLSYLQRYLEEY